MLVTQRMKRAAVVAAMLVVGCSDNLASNTTSPGGGTQPGSIDTSTNGLSNGDVTGGVELIWAPAPPRGDVARRQGRRLLVAGTRRE